MAANRITELFMQEGQSAWQDDISRDMLNQGAIARAIKETGIRGLTSNPTIFEKAIAAGNAYDTSVAELVAQGVEDLDIFESVAVADIQAACDLFRDLYDSSNGGDGYVSIEVSPLGARDAERTEADARRLWKSVNRPNLMVKIPGTLEGSPVIQQMLDEGININVTLLFSVEAYERVARAYIAALKARHARGESVDRIASVASFFVSRVDALVDKQLDALIADATNDAKKAELEALKGKAAIANAKLAYKSFQDIFSGSDWDTLVAADAKVQRPLWASTSVKNPAYPDTLYVDELIGPDTVNTMPRPTIEAFLDHGTVNRTIDTGVEEAAETMAALETAGIDFQAVTDQLEEEGIASFVKSFESLLAGVASKRAQLAATPAD